MKVTHLAHVELACRDVEASCEFLRDVFGLVEVGRADGSIYLRCWGDWQSHSVILSPGGEPRAAHLAWGVDDPSTLGATAEALAERGIKTWWEDGEPFQARALRFDVGDGQTYELLSDELRTPVGDVGSRLHAQPLPLRGVGIEPRRLDHCHVGTDEFEATSAVFRELLGFKIREQVNLPSGEPLTHFLSVNSQVHDIAVRRASALDFHHIALWIDSREHMLRSAELLCHRGVLLPCQGAVRQPSRDVRRAVHRLRAMDPAAVDDGTEGRDGAGAGVLPDRPAPHDAPRRGGARGGRRMSAPTLAAVELRCPELERSRAFFTEVLGLVESSASDGEVALRCVGESAYASVVLRAGEKPGVTAIVLHDPDDGSDWPARTSDGCKSPPSGARRRPTKASGSSSTSRRRCAGWASSHDDSLMSR